MDLPTFRVRFPAFNKAPDTLVQAKIDAALRRCSAASWGDLRDDGVALWTAHQLTMEPEGREVRIANQQSGTSTYKDQFDALAMVAGFGPVVV